MEGKWKRVVGFKRKKNVEMKMQWMSLMICLYAGMASGRTEEDQASLSGGSTELRVGLPPPERCFYQSQMECPEVVKSDDCPCKRIPILSHTSNDENAVYCCNLSAKSFEFGLACANFPSNVSYIHIRNATLDVFNVSEVKWRRLKSLAITDGRINRIKGQFLMMTPTQCLNLSNNGLIEIENNSFTRLAQLTSLDLSYNNVTHLPALNTMHGREFWIDISGTNTLMCHDVYQSINKTGEKQIHFNRENETLCSASKTWHWFNTTEQVPLKQVRYLSQLQTECPKGDNWQCQCNFRRMDIVEGKSPTLAVNVDCTGMQLTELPDRLPRNTIALNVSYNNITVLDYLSTNHWYEDLREFYADYNNISSINKLEGSKFLDNYAFLSLRYNKIKSLPTYILSLNGPDKNYALSKAVKLGGNALHCDCNTAKHLKGWLQARILDADEVLCEKIKERVTELDASKMCVYPGDWTDYIYYIIATEVLLLISLVAKVSYDYWVFKTAGYLPWPANKMPKLPCDWLCET
ncbi:protein halfway [Diachasma alloeum]|uniref:protein halfway n=1 Tax=Diachasma alloeum TaxID=454923 RepID=UPI0007383A4D|nr:protein halfway [Diachasma alloeum]XP_015122048.1 protein halfway [Diachasma alloeum]